MVGNMEPAAGRAKEPWLAPLLPTLQQGITRMKDFITRLVEMEEEEGERRPLAPPSTVLKEGLLFVHKTRGKGPLLSAASKKLHFCLTGESLSFSKSPGAEVGGSCGAVWGQRGGTDPLCVSLPSAEWCHRPAQHPCGREGGGEELRERPRHAGGLHGCGRAAGDGLPAVQGGMEMGGTLGGCHSTGPPFSPLTPPAVCE